MRCNRRCQIQNLWLWLCYCLSSLLTEWVKGKNIDEAEQIKNTAIAEELALPPVKIHCSVLAEDAIKAAVRDVREKQEK